MKISLSSIEVHIQSVYNVTFFQNSCDWNVIGGSSNSRGMIHAYPIYAKREVSYLNMMHF